MPVDRVQREISVGDLVSIPAVITAIGGTSARPTVQFTSKYAGFDGNTDTLTELDSIQVMKDDGTKS